MGRAVVNTHNAAQNVVAKAIQQLDSLQHLSQKNTNTSVDSLQNPYFTSLLGTPMLYPGSVKRLFALGGTHNDGAFGGSVAHMLHRADSTLIGACIAYPQLALPYVESINDDHGEETVAPTPPAFSLSPTVEPKHDGVHDMGLPTFSSDGGDGLGLLVRRPNFWNFKTNFSLQFTQNYVSDNWYKGGESHNTLLAATVIEANYNNQRKLTFDNKLEMKLGFQSSHNDDEHKYKTNSDLLRLTNKLGLRAVKHWYYTVMLQSWTQFYKGYKSNDKKVYSDFMSPFESLLSVGMDYQYTTKKNRFNISATLSPLALKFKYVDRASLATSFGLDEGKHTLWEYGSNITINYKWDIIKNVSWTGRLYYFTDYSSTQLEWENTFNLSINRYLSAKLFLYPRFDDSRNRDENQSNFEFNELLSLGLNVNF